MTPAARDPLRASDVRAAFYLIMILFTVSFLADLAIAKLEVPGIIYTLAPMPFAYAFASRYLDQRLGGHDPAEPTKEPQP